MSIQQDMGSSINDVTHRGGKGFTISWRCVT